MNLVVNKLSILNTVLIGVLGLPAFGIFAAASEEAVEIASSFDRFNESDEYFRLPAGKLHGLS